MPFRFFPKKRAGRHLTKTIIVCSGKLETEIIISHLTRKKVHSMFGYECLTGNTDNREVTILSTGKDNRFYKESFQTLASSILKTEIIFFSTCPSVNSKILPGDVVTANIPFSWKIENSESPLECVLPGSTSSSISSKGKELCLYSSKFNHWHGSVVTHDNWKNLSSRINWSALKPEIHCVDNFTGFASRICQRNEIPFAVIKGITHVAGAETTLNLSQLNLKAIIHGNYYILDYLNSDSMINDWI